MKTSAGSLHLQRGNAARKAMKMCIPSSKLNKQKSVWFLCEGKGSLIIPSEARPTVLPGHALWGWVALKAPAGTASPKPSFGRTKAECSSGTHGRAPPPNLSLVPTCVNSESRTHRAYRYVGGKGSKITGLGPWLLISP